MNGSKKIINAQELKILIIRLKPIGDTVLISPVFRNIKRLYPGAKIEVIIYPFVFDVIKNNPYVDRVIILKRNIFSKFIFYIKSLFKFYNVIIDYINNPTSTIIALLTHAEMKIGNKTKRNFFYDYRLQSSKREYSSIRCLRLLQPIGLTKFNDYLPELYLDNKDITAAASLLSDLKLKGNIIGLFVSAKYPTRQYSSKHFIKLGELIAEKTSYKVLFILGKGDILSLNEIKKITGNNKNISFISEVVHGITVGELSALIARLKFLITSDTGPKHIATALKIPSLTIFTSTDEKVWNPPDLKKYPIIKTHLKCAPCHKKECPLNTLECTINLTPEKIFSAFKAAFRL